MKRTCTLLAAGIMTLVMSSCGGPQKPEDVAKTFVKAMNQQDWATAKEVATDSTKKMISAMKGMMKMSGKKSSPKTGEFKKVKNTKVDGKKAVVTYCCGKNGKDSKVHLRKVNGNWKVDLNKGGASKSGSGSSSGPGS